MAELSLSLSEEELIDEVRDALAGIDGSKIPDGTIIQTAERFIVPLLNDITGTLTAADDQNDFDNAVIAWTAEMSFGAWLTFTRLRDREVEIFIDSKQYKNNLKKKTNYALRMLDTSRPPEIPNHVVTIKHDGVNRTVDLQQVWEYE
jgi:hypothetical protein